MGPSERQYIRMSSSVGLSLNIPSQLLNVEHSKLFADSSSTENLPDIEGYVSSETSNSRGYVEDVRSKLMSSISLSNIVLAA